MSFTSNNRSKNKFLPVPSQLNGKIKQTERTRQVTSHFGENQKSRSNSEAQTKTQQSITP